MKLTQEAKSRIKRTIAGEVLDALTPTVFAPEAAAVRERATWTPPVRLRVEHEERAEPVDRRTASAGR